MWAHYGQLFYFFSARFSCLRICLANVDEWLNGFAQISHWNGRRPECACRCRRKLFLCRKRRGQSLWVQAYGVSPVKKDNQDQVINQFQFKCVGAVQCTCYQFDPIDFGWKDGHNWFVLPVCKRRWHRYVTNCANWRPQSSLKRIISTKKRWREESWDKQSIWKKCN